MTTVNDHKSIKNYIRNRKRTLYPSTRCTLHTYTYVDPKNKQAHKKISLSLCQALPCSKNIHSHHHRIIVCMSRTLYHLTVHFHPSSWLMSQYCQIFIHVTRICTEISYMTSCSMTYYRLLLKGVFFAEYFLMPMLFSCLIWKIIEMWVGMEMWLGSDEKNEMWKFLVLNFSSCKNFGFVS